MNAIVAVDLNWGIGYNGDLLYRIKEDMKRFKMRTMNNVVVMGRKTFESLPNGKPLKNRMNIILSRQDVHYDYDNVIVMHSVEEVLDYCKDKETYCIGRTMIYKVAARCPHYVSYTKKIICFIATALSAKLIKSVQLSY